MTEADPPEEATLFPKTAGEKLKEAREAQGLSLAEIAARTRVPVRQLEAIETSNYTALPSVTYAVGFSKAYARAVGIDEVAIAREVRGQNEQNVRRTEYEAYEINEPKRTPTGGIALAGLAVAALLIVAVALWYGTNLFRSEDGALPAPAAQSEIVDPVPVADPTPAAPTGGQVTLVATDEVWLRIYDATGKSLYENTLKAGDRFDVPADANNPMINVGRPDKLQVLLNGSQLPPLGDGRLAIKDVGVSAAALQARMNGTPLPTPVPGATTGATVPSTTPRRPAAQPPRRVPAPAPTAATDSAPIVTPPSAPAADATPTP